MLFENKIIDILTKNKQVKMYSVKQMYSSPKGNAGESETICRVKSLEEAKEFWKNYCEKNSTEEFFNEEGYNCFYIEDEDGMVEETYETGFFEEFNCKCCKIWFDEGKDNCKNCGFDLNSLNEEEEEEE